MAEFQETLTLAGILDDMDSGALIAILAISGGLFISVIYFIMDTVKSTANTKQREQTKREVAAYIAEGSMTPEQGERILRSDVGKQRTCA